MRPESIVGFAQTQPVLRDVDHDDAELVQQATALALEEAGLSRKDIGFVCSGSSDYVEGRPFSFVLAMDGIGAWPPIRESHVEMDGAWALYEAWVRLQHGDVDTALVYAFGKASLGDVDDVLTMQLDPYYLAPLRPDPTALAALQARVLLDRGCASERDFAGIVARNLRSARQNPKALRSGDVDVDGLLSATYVASPLRAHDASTRGDGAAAIVLRAGRHGPVIRSIAHRIEPQGLGLRDLGRSASTRAAAGDTSGVEAAELHAPYGPQELVLRDALRLDEAVIVNASGGALACDVPMVTGLVRIGEASRAIRAGAGRALAHATQGPCLQQNLVCMLESP